MRVFRIRIPCDTKPAATSPTYSTGASQSTTYGTGSGRASPTYSRQGTPADPFRSCLTPAAIVTVDFLADDFDSDDFF